jgi:hypothetical protein
MNFNIKIVKVNNEIEIDVRKDCRWVRFNITGEIIKMGKYYDYGTCKPTEEELIKWQQFIKDNLKEIIENNKWNNIDLYIRFGDIPKNKRSKNYITGELEKGVSCYEAEYNLKNNCFKLAGEVSNPGALIGHKLANSKIYLITGEFIDYGSDGEPLLSRVKVLGEIFPDYKIEGFKLKI